MTRAAWLVPSVFLSACAPRTLAPTPDGGGGPGSIAGPGRVATTSDAGNPGSDPVTGGGGGIPDPNSGAPACAPLAEIPAPITPSPPRARVPTTPPFSCNPLPPVVIFPPPGPGVPGAFSRCASFDIGEARRLAVSADGRVVALIPADGVVRLVEVATRQVIAVLAPARASIDFAAIEPAGRGVLTLDSASLEVTFWRAADWTPVWTAALPGHRFGKRWGGGVAFAPDGKSAIASAGDGTFLLDVATGAMRAMRPARGAMMDLAYGWGGRRVVVAEASTAAHCTQYPNGGLVTVLDAATLADVATVADLGGYGDPRGRGGAPAFLASPNDDLVLTTNSIGEPAGVRSFRLSDGAALGAPALDKVPIAFLPEGKVLVRASGLLAIAPLAGGEKLSSIPDDGTTPLAVLPDGRVLQGGRGQQLLRLWDIGAASSSVLCRGGDPGVPPPYGVQSSLSADGQTIALGGGRRLQVLRVADGTLLSTILVDDPGPQGRVVLAPDARFLVAAPWWEKASSVRTIVFHLDDGAPVVDLPSDSSSTADFVFSPRETKLYTTGSREGMFRLDVASLEPGGATTVESLPASSSLIGFSQGCPVLYEGSRGAWRACGACADPGIGGPGAPAKDNGIPGAVLSPDGRLVAVRGLPDGPGVTLWPMQPGATALRTFPRRTDEGGWNPREYPIAVASGGARVVAGASVVSAACYSGGAYETRVYDGATGALTDALPPGVTSVDSEVRTVAFGAQLWCAR